MRLLLIAATTAKEARGCVRETTSVSLAALLLHAERRVY
jgi:hypothetical protein